MSGKAGQGGLSVAPVRRTRLIAATAVLWLLLLLVLGGWWTYHMWQQAQTIAELQSALPGGGGGIPWQRTRRMLAGESAVFLILLLTLTFLLARLYWREQRRARSTQAFFSAVTHELRTPLTSIRLQAEAIAEGDQRAELARRLLEDTHKLESQIDKTLELARVEGGGPLAEQAVPLSAWLRRVLPDLAATYGARLKLEDDVDEQLPPVAADAGALQMILRNLVENSVRHSGRDPVTVRLTAMLEEGRVCFRFEDDGKGLGADAAAAGTLYGRGARSSGAGVGLYLVRMLAQRMGGAARFGSAEQGGFRADVRLAISRDNGA